jgi:transposase
LQKVSKYCIIDLYKNRSYAEMTKVNEIKLDGFYPESLKITRVTNAEKQITIYLKSQKHSHKCHKCGKEMTSYHGTYTRTVQDLPILGKKVTLKISAYEYHCQNTACPIKAFTEDYEGFIGKSERMTRRCEELIKAIASETSCEGAAAICGKIGIKVSGDTIIRMVKKAVEGKPAEKCSETVGVDDFAYRKGQTYCTIICDGESREPIEILEGRDGKTLREWLGENKHIKKVTRDRASAYAKAISDILPEAMQIADRFHLHQNLLCAVKEALSGIISNEVLIPNEMPELENNSPSEAAIPSESGDKKN